MPEVCNDIEQANCESSKLDKFDDFMAKQALKKYEICQKELPKIEDLLNTVCGKP